jgi:chromosome segregation ATPase
MDSPAFSASVRFISMLSDRAAAHDVISEISKAKARCTAAMAQARDFERQALRDQARLAIDIKAFEGNKAAFLNFISEHASTLDRAEAEMSAREVHLNDRMIELERVRTELVSKIDGLREKQAEHAAATNQLAARKDDYSTQSSLLQSKLERLAGIAKMR